ncbi:MAG: alpha/beta fold hydrolase [Candidatus Dormibacteria bacterium]
MSYRERGTGHPIVMLHAALHDHHDFDPIVGPLARRYRTIAVDWPAHGESAALPADMEPGGPLFADVLEDVVDALQLPPAAFIGNSVGGFAAGRLAITRPECVAALVLVNSGGFNPLDAVTRTFCRAMGTPFIARLAMPGLVRSYMKAKTDNDQAVSARARARAKTKDGIATVAALWRSFLVPEYDLRDRAAAITAPTLLLWGARDTVLPMRAARATQQAIPGAQLESLKTGHVAFSSDPVGFLGHLLPFLERTFAGHTQPAETGLA